MESTIWFDVAVHYVMLLMDREHLRNSILVLRDSIPPGVDKGHYYT